MVFNSGVAPVFMLQMINISGPSLRIDRNRRNDRPLQLTRAYIYN